MDKFQMLDEIIVLVDKLADSRGVERCSIIVDIINRLGALKKGMKNEDSVHNQHVEMLKAQLKNMNEPPTVKDGEIVQGGQTYHIDFKPMEE